VGQVLGHVVDPLFHLVALPVDFLFSWSSISQKNGVAKRLDLFDVLTVCESQKHAKTSKFLRNVKSK
jgi:hypothetical protein